MKKGSKSPSILFILLLTCQCPLEPHGTQIQGGVQADLLGLLDDLCATLDVGVGELELMATLLATSVSPTFL